MADKLTPEQRHRCMSRIRGRDTRPEILVRKGLFARGFRFRLQDRKLPGRPDITLPRWGVAVMVNGCFWHGHQGCRYANKPRTNPEFWTEKIERNRRRDAVTAAHLEGLGWHVITVWECEIRTVPMAEARLDALAEEIRIYGLKRSESKAERKSAKELVRQERRAARQRECELEREVDSFFKVPSRIRKLSKQRFD